MQCPNCEGVLPGSVVVCKNCGHRLTQASIEKWRTERAALAGDQPQTKESALAAKMRARFANNQTAKSDANLIHFPVSPNAPLHTATAAPAEPEWRTRVKTSVQHHRQRQTTEIGEVREATIATTTDTANAEATDAAAQLLLVESALKRIRRTATLTERVASSAIQYPSAQSQALSLMLEAERYAAAQRQVEVVEVDEPVIERQPPAASRPVNASAHTTSASVTTSRLRSGRGQATSLALRLDEDPSAEPYDFAPDTLPLTTEDLLELAPMQKANAEQTTAERLRAVAAYHAATQTDSEADTEEPAPSPWHTDAEIADHKNQVWLGKPAPIWLRTLAGICDIEAAAMLYLPFFGAYYTMEGALDGTDYYVMALMVVVVMFLYQLVTLTLNERTFGMAIFGLRNFDVEKASSHISFKRRLQQAFGGTVGLLCPPFNFFVTRVTGFQRGFGDALAKTVTLRRAQD